MRRSFAIVPWLALGSALAGATYWAFLNTPDSNAIMLALSVILLVVSVVIIGVTMNMAVLVAHGVAAGAALKVAPRGLGFFVIAAVPVVAGWWVVGRADAFIAEGSGEMNAWIIARGGPADISLLLTAGAWISRWLRWVILPMASVSLLAALLVRTPARPRSLRRVWHWRPLVIGTLAFVLLLVLPWQLATWRPTLPPSWVEPAVVALRLGLVFLLGTTGAAVMIVAAAGADGARAVSSANAVATGAKPLA